MVLLLEVVGLAIVLVRGEEVEYEELTLLVLDNTAELLLLSEGTKLLLVAL